MRRRILLVALSAAGLAMLLLGAPLAVAIHSGAVSDARARLDQAALGAAVRVSPTYLDGDPVELPSPRGIRVALYDAGGHRVSGTGPDRLEPDLAHTATGGQVGEQTSSGEYVEVVPVSSREHVIASVRAASDTRSVDATVAKRLGELAGLALAAVAGAMLLAFTQARRLSRHMGDLAEAATQLDAGDLSVRPPVCGVPEIDQTGAAFSATATRLIDQIERERSFTARASHQLRTPLTRLRLELETGLAGTPGQLDASVREALETADFLSETVDEVLELARTPPGRRELFDLEDVVNELVARWRGPLAAQDRPVNLVIDEPPRAAASPVAVRQILQVLLDNAWRHGSGRVTVTVRDTAGNAAVDVHDRGQQDVTWPESDSGRQRLGLAMARTIAEAQRGRLLLASDARGTRFTLIVPGENLSASVE